MAIQDTHWYGDCPEAVHRERLQDVQYTSLPARVTCDYCHSWMIAEGF